MTSPNLSISFCIVCMNRLHQLQQTLLQNIIDNADYDNLEFVLLDYNSQDGMKEWVMQHCAAYLDSGRLVYYHTLEPQEFSHSHSKNLAFKLAKGELVCNINADHYTGKGYAHYINEQFRATDNIVLTTIDYFRTQTNYYPAKDVFGKVCVKKTDFLYVNGFDESMRGYGFEDYDFINRLELFGKKREFIRDNSFLQFISHEEAERYTLYAEKLHAVYINYYAPAHSDAILLFHDYTFIRAGIVDKLALQANDYRRAYAVQQERFEYTVKEPGLIKGSWKVVDDLLMLQVTEGDQLEYTAKENMLVDKNNGKQYYQLTDSESIDGLMVFNYFFANRSIMEENLSSKKIIVNENGFGHAADITNLAFEKLMQ